MNKVIDIRTNVIKKTNEEYSRLKEEKDKLDEEIYSLRIKIAILEKEQFLISQQIEKIEEKIADELIIF